jgi:signal transduction histidine kinase
MKLRFLAMVSHELRTPLASIKGFTTTLLADDVVWSPEQYVDFLTIIDDEADKLTGLIDQLLDLSRLQSGALSIQPDIYAFDDVLDAAIVHLEVVTENHDLVLAIEDDLPRINVDTERVAQVLVNLVDNAAKYCPVHTTITVSARAIPDAVQVDVADQGPGIREDVRERVFEAFQQGGKSKSGQGFGLGLAICRGIIAAHGGHLWVDPTYQGGTRMSFTLPAAP